MNNLTLKEKVAKVLFDVEAVKISVNEPFTFASGIKSPIYCDNRIILGHPDEREKIVESFLEIIDIYGLDRFIRTVRNKGYLYEEYLEQSK